MIFLQKILYEADGRKTPKYKQWKTPHLFTHPSPIYKIEADSFPVPENTENKPDLP